jgi:hypothetical protein
MRCENLVKLTAANLTLKMRVKTRKHTSMGENCRSCGNLAWSDPAHRHLFKAWQMNFS